MLIVSDLQAAYDSILKEIGVQNKTCSRKLLKKNLIQRTIDDVEFHKPKRVNESERITIKETKDAVIQLLIQESDVKDDMKTLYDATLYLRKAINKSKKGAFEDSLVGTLSKDHFPEELYCFFRWVINGPNTTLSTEEKCREIYKRAMSLVQSTISMCLTERQVDNKRSAAAAAVRNWSCCPPVWQE